MELGDTTPAAIRNKQLPLNLEHQTVDALKSYYETYWQVPEEYHDPSTPARESLLRQHVDVGAGTVLDAGCGTGHFCSFFQTIGLVPEGYDLSDAVIKYTTKKFPGIRFFSGDLEALLGSREQHYDLIFSSEVIEHVFDVHSWLSTLNKLLKPRGKLILTTPYHGFLKNIAINMIGHSKHYDPLGQHIRFFDKTGLARCLTATGFRPKVWRGYGRPWPFWKSMFVVAEKVAPPKLLHFRTQGAVLLDS